MNSTPVRAAPVSALVEPLARAAVDAGLVILAVRAEGVAVEAKSDASPVTKADRAAEAVILAALGRVAPRIPVVAEEACAAGVMPAPSERFFLVDPLDGTKEFIAGKTDFTVNIGLVDGGVPVLGVVFAPALGALYAGAAGEGAWAADVAPDGAIGPRRPIRVRERPDGPVDVVASRSHRTSETDAYIARYDVGNLVSAGSSLKFCRLAEGAADLYPRLGPTMQWDTAAGDAVLRAAGGRVVTLDGRPLPYGPDGAPGAAAYRNPWFVAVGGTRLLP